MVYQVTCYKNTGFGNGNIPSSPSVLENADKVQLTANQVWKLQDKYLSRVRLQMAYDVARTVDYVKIGNSYYTVSALSMTNNVAEFTLSYDPINSVGGIGQFQILDGWAERAHANHDDMFENILDEPYTPMKELVMDPIDALGNPDITDYRTVVGATVDLSDLTYQASQYVDADSGNGVTVPKIPSIPVETTVHIGRLNETLPTGWSEMKQKLPNMTIFNFDAQSVKDGIQSVRSLGLTDTITACYQLPSTYAEGTVVGGVLGHLYAPIQRVASKLPYKYGTYKPKNNKVYAMFNKFNLLAMASGDRQEYEARELYAGGNQPDFYIYADPSPNGKPYAQPTHFENRTTLPFQESVAGAEWLSTPLAFGRPEGWARTMANYNRQSKDLVRSYERQSFDEGVGAVGGLLKGNLPGILDSGLGLYRSTEDIARAAQRADFDFYASMRIVAPEIRFGRGAEISGYVFNGFVVYRTRLSEEDMERFDNFLTMYGYAQSRRLKQDDLSSRQKFNFVKASNVAVTGPSLMDRNAISDMFAGGIRLWHVLPNRAAMSDNPIKAVS